MTDTPKRSADSYQNEYDRKHNEAQTTFSKTTRSSFWRRLNRGIHFPDSKWILPCGKVSLSYIICNQKQRNYELVSIPAATPWRLHSMKRIRRVSNPPIITSSLVCTKARVLMLPRSLLRAACKANLNG